MSSRDDIVITGVGVVSPIGIGRQPFWESLLSGTSGVGPITLFDPSALPVRFGGELKGFDPKDYVQPRKAIKLMARELQTAFAAASLATKDAGLEVASLDHDRLGVLYGSEMLFGDPNELAQIYQQSIDEGQFHIWNFGGKILTELYPLWMLKYLPNMAACHVGISHDARGPNNTIVQDDASSLLAVCEAVHVMQRGHADVMIVGGVGSRLSLSPLIFRGDTDLSHRHESPQQASRPFDLHRDGMVNGEGAAAFVFERRSHAEARGAKPLCQILGFSRMFGSSSAGTAPPATETITRSINGALQDAGASASDIGHVNAHGLGTIAGDRAEAIAIASTLGDTPVTAPKSFFGNLGAGSGAVEMAATVLALHSGTVPHTLNFETPDPECPVNVISHQAAPLKNDAAMVLSQSAIGHAAAVVLGVA